MTQDTKGQGVSGTGTAVAGPQGDPAAAPNPQDPGGSDYAAMQRTVNEFQDGTRLPKALQKRGYESLDDVPTADELAELQSRTASKPSGEKPSETGEFVLDRDPKSGRPKMPLQSDEQFLDPTTGQFDEARYAAGVEYFHDERDAWHARGTAEQAEATYLAEAAKSDDAKPVVAALQKAGIGQEDSEDIIGIFANTISGGKPANREHVRNGVAALKAFADAYADTKFAESAAEEAANAAGEGEDAGTAGGGRPPQKTGGESDKPQTIEEMAAEGAREMRAERAAR